MIDRTLLAPHAIKVRQWFQRQSRKKEPPNADAVWSHIRKTFPTFDAEQQEYLFQNHDTNHAPFAA